MHVILLLILLLFPTWAQGATLFSETFEGYGTEAQTATALRARYVCRSLEFGRIPWSGDATQRGG